MNKKRIRFRRNKQEYFVKRSIIVMIFLMACITIGYSAFQTVTVINARGSIKQVNFYVSFGGSDVSGDGTKASPYESIQKAYSMISKKGTIYIMDNITQNKTVTFNSNKDVTLTSYLSGGNVNTITRGDTVTGYLINQTLGSLTLKDIIIDGNNVAANNAIIQSYNLTIDDGTIIEKGNNTNSSGSGGGLKASGTLIIKGGVIQNNNSNYNGGGIAFSGSLLTITGGIIKENTSRYGGAIRITNQAIFNMSGGVISNNTAQGTGGAIEITHQTVTTISGGKIINNNSNSGAIWIHCLNVDANCPTVTLTGGIVGQNVSTNSNGGIFFQTGSFSNNGAIICENIPGNDYENLDVCPDLYD